MASLRAGSWQIGLGETLRGRTLGIFGYGRIGRAVAGYGRAFGMRVLVWSREPARLVAADDGHDVATDQSELFEQSDVLCLHVRLVSGTKGIVTATDLARMNRPGYWSTPAAPTLSNREHSLLRCGPVAPDRPPSMCTRTNQ